MMPATEVKLHDPLVYTIQSIFWSCFTFLDSDEIRRLTTDTLKLNLLPLHRAVVKVLENIQDSEEEPPALAYFLTEFDEVKKTYYAVDAVMELMINSSGLKHLATESGREELKSRFREAEGLLATVTLTHVTLQTHLMRLAYSEFGATLYGKAAELLAPLVELRDEYFATPRSDVLTEYIVLADAVASGAEYQTHVKNFANEYLDSPEVRGKQVEELLNQLEVRSMLEALDSAQVKESSWL